MKRLSVFILCLFLGMNLIGKTLTGIYFTFHTKVSSYLFQQNQSTKLNEPLSFDNVNLFLSIYKENIFAVNLNLNTETYVNHETREEIKMYGISFEIGKVISTQLVLKNKKILSPDLTGGIYFKLDPFISGSSENPENCIVASPWTTPSHMSMLTSLYPSTHGITSSFGELYGGLIEKGYKNKQNCECYGTNNGNKLNNNSYKT